jgi:hypothetical protein
MIGDLVRFADVEEREVILTGRIKQFLSLCGEHLSLDNINEAIVSTAEKMKIEISEFCIYPETEHQRHSWFIGVTGKVDNKKLLGNIDKKLKELNDDYASARKYTLKDPEITLLQPEHFYGFMDSIGKSGSQNKFPRVMNTKQSQLWLNYLKETNLIP